MTPVSVILLGVFYLAGTVYAYRLLPALPTVKGRPVSSSSPLFNSAGGGEEVTVAQRKSIGVPVEAGKTYWWCACGKSENQPFCDGAHSLCYTSLNSDISPVEYEATETKTVFFCQCKQSKKAPLCDGTHKKLPEDAEGKSYPQNSF